MKNHAAPAFVAGWARLSREEQDAFLAIVRTQFNPACERFREDSAMTWPRGLRIKRVQGIPGVWEMTWSFAGPDGRATFEWVDINGELAVRWRRIGGHDIFGRP